MKNLPQPWSAAMEATMFSGWIYDHLRPHAVKVAHPLMLRAIAAAKKRNDRIDANKLLPSASGGLFASSFFPLNEDPSWMSVITLLMEPHMKLRFRFGVVNFHFFDSGRFSYLNGYLRGFRPTPTSRGQSSRDLRHASEARYSLVEGGKSTPLLCEAISQIRRSRTRTIYQANTFTDQRRFLSSD